MNTETDEPPVINCICGRGKGHRGEELPGIEGSESRFFVCEKCNGTIVVLKGEE